MTRTRRALPKRGRPRKGEEAKRQDAFLDYCLSQFMELGYRNTTMDGLAQGFGAGKSTIYARYGSKAGLVRAVMQRGVPLLLTPLEAVETDQPRAPRDVLRDFGAIMQRYSCDPSVWAMWRSVSEAREDLGKSLDEEIRESSRRIMVPVADYLAAQEKRGTLAVGDPVAAAACFAELTSGGVAQFLGGPVPEKERKAALEFALDLFLNGVIPRK